MPPSPRSLVRPGWLLAVALILAALAPGCSVLRPQEPQVMNLSARRIAKIIANGIYTLPPEDRLIDAITAMEFDQQHGGIILTGVYLPPNGTSANMRYHLGLDLVEGGLAVTLDPEESGVIDPEDPRWEKNAQAITEELARAIDPDDPFEVQQFALNEEKLTVTFINK